MMVHLLIAMDKLKSTTCTSRDWLVLKVPHWQVGIIWGLLKMKGI